MRCAPVLFAALSLACQSEGARIALPPPYEDGSIGLTMPVAGAHAGDLWFPPYCDYESGGGSGLLAFWRRTSGWAKVATESPCLSTGGSMASLEEGTIVVTDGYRLLVVDAGGEVADHTLDGEGVTGRMVLSVTARDGAAYALVGDPYVTDTGGNAVAGAILAWDGSAFVRIEAPPAWSPGTLAGRLLAMGPDDLWLLGSGGAASATWMDGYEPANRLWHHDGQSWREHAVDLPMGYGWSPSFAPDDIWAVRPGDPITGVYLHHFDGSSWTATGMPSPFYDEDGVVLNTTVAGVYPGQDGRLRVLAVTWAAAGSLNSGRANELVYTWDGEAFDEPVEISTHAVLACSQPPCGLQLSGELGDGTVVRSREQWNLNQPVGKSQIVLWRP